VLCRRPADAPATDRCLDGLPSGSARSRTRWAISARTEPTVDGPAALADVSLTDLSQHHLTVGALYKEFLLIELGCEPRPDDPGYDVYMELRNRMSVADSTTAAAFDDWERHCATLARILTAEVLHQLTRDNANPSTDVTLAMLTSP